MPETPDAVWSNAASRGAGHRTRERRTAFYTLGFFFAEFLGQLLRSGIIKKIKSTVAGHICDDKTTEIYI